MNTEKKIPNGIPNKPKNPFKVPDGYFEHFPEKVLAKIDEQDIPQARKIYLKPYLSLAASISGLALIIYLVLQSIVGNNLNRNGYYDLALLEEAGIANDESLIAETYSSTETPYSEWEEDAMNYLASNELDLIHLIETN